MTEKPQHEKEILKKERFSFGGNWKKYLQRIEESSIADARGSLIDMLRVKNLNGKTFIDVGSGSGLFSLAASELGAKVTSFDYDPLSVQCTKTIQDNFYTGDKKDWIICSGSILDVEFVNSLGKYDYVYSWGVLHHTGNMNGAFKNINRLVKEGGFLFISIYNDQGLLSKYWKAIKISYNRYVLLRPFIVLIHFICPVLPSIAIKKIKQVNLPRGMKVWYDLLDWLGGYPFEVAKPEEILGIFRGMNYSLIEMKTVGGKHGCNEFVFHKDRDNV